ncbi:MAG TPA: hypothetical protein VMW83_01750 [Spirochaetia bacterium]|nr:hypothetical protein [Spirochaetia bacterium]
MEDIHEEILKVAGGYRLVLEAGTLNFALLSAGEQEAVEEAFGGLLFSPTFYLQFFIQTRPVALTGEVERVQKGGAAFSGPSHPLASPLYGVRVPEEVPSRDKYAVASGAETR